MKILPKNGYVLVSEPPREQKSTGGIIIPESALAQSDEQATFGVVIESAHEDYKKDDTVLFSKVLPLDYEIETKDGKKRVWFISHEDILGIVTK